MLPGKHKFRGFPSMVNLSLVLRSNIWWYDMMIWCVLLCKCPINKLKTKCYRISFSCANTNPSIPLYSSYFLIFHSQVLNRNSYLSGITLILYIYMKVISEKLDVRFYLTVRGLNKSKRYYLQTLISVRQ